VVLDLVDCPDRRLAKAAAEMVLAEVNLPGVGVTAVLPRRSYTPLLGRLLHDRSADKIASVVSQIPHAAATIVPFDVRSRVEVLLARDRERATSPAGDHAPGPGTGQASPGKASTGQASTGQASTGQASTGQAGTVGSGAVIPASTPDAGGGTGGDRRVGPGPGDPMTPDLIPAAMPESDGSDYNRPIPSRTSTPIGALPKRGRATVEGRVHAVEIRPVERNTVLACEIVDSTGALTAMFYGRSHIPGLDPGAKVRLTGQVGTRGHEVVMVNPAYELLTPGKGDSQAQ
jgi:hypothetical protein